jgi:glycosyltransferase involved in cell wall biosynthesis
MTSRVQLISKASPGVTGTSRYTSELLKGVATAGVEAFCSQPHVPQWINRAAKGIGVDACAFFNSYPIRVEPVQADLVHITTQTMATLLHVQRFTAPVVVTVLDIIPYLVRDDLHLRTFGHRIDEQFYRLALAGLRRADALIAISEYTKRTLVEQLHINPDKIYVTHLGVDQEQFHPLDVPEAFYQHYGLNTQSRYVLYVGSEDPRKNLETLVRAFALAKRDIPELVLLKVGPAQFSQERSRLQALINELDIQESVRFYNHVSDSDLPLFYNAADLSVMPSLYEGFGLPVLEAMACGTPVIASNTTSLPEIISHEDALFDPLDANSLSEKMIAFLGAKTTTALFDYRKHVQRFSWHSTVSDTLRCYEAVDRKWA